MAVQIKNFTVTVATNGLSSAINTEGMTPFAIVTSTALTGTSMTFQAAVDGTNYNNVYTDDGTEYTFTVGASRHVFFRNPEYFLGANGLKVRMGTSTAASTQAGARTMTLMCRGL